MKTLQADGISIESFQLSDQANILYEKNILPLVRIRKSPKASSFSSFSSKTSAMKKLAQQASGQSGGKGNGKKVEPDSAENDNKIELDGEEIGRASCRERV